jgi:uncharacterized membrane protein
MLLLLLSIYILSVILDWLICKFHAMKDPGIIDGVLSVMIFIPVINIIEFVVLLTFFVSDYIHENCIIGEKIVNFLKLNK